VDYLFLILAIVWAAQFGLAYWQLRRFHSRIAALRKLGRTAVGMHGNRWRGRTYAVLTLDGEERIRKAEIFDGWSIFSQLRPVPELEGRGLDSLREGAPALAGLRPAQLAAFQHAASFLEPKAQTA
jgi:glucitol operon activator protein